MYVNLQPKGSVTYLTSDTVDVVLSDGSAWEVTEVLVANNVFLAVGDTFTVKVYIYILCLETELQRLSELNKD